MIFLRRIYIVIGLVFMAIGFLGPYWPPLAGNLNIVRWLLLNVACDIAAIGGLWLTFYGLHGYVRQKDAIASFKTKSAHEKAAAYVPIFGGVVMIVIGLFILTDATSGITSSAILAYSLGEIRLISILGVGFGVIAFFLCCLGLEGKPKTA